MRKSTNEEVLVETTWSELEMPSGIYDEESQRQLSNMEAIELVASGLGAYLVYLNGNGHLSEEASRHNSQVTRTGEGEHLIAVVAKYPPATTK